MTLTYRIIAFALIFLPLHILDDEPPQVTNVRVVQLQVDTRTPPAAPFNLIMRIKS